MMVSDNVPGPGLFNATGSSGRFHVSWMPNDGGWTRGPGYINQGDASHDSAASPANFAGITLSRLYATLVEHPAVTLDTLAVTNSLAASNGAFLAALVDADPLTLLLHAVDDQVAFNFTSHLYGDDRGTNIYATEIHLTASPLPASSAAVRSVDGVPFLEMRFPRLAGVTSLVYSVEARSDLGAGGVTWLAGASNGVPMAGPGLVAEADSGIPAVSEITVRDTVPLGSDPRRFLILRISR